MAADQGHAVSQCRIGNFYAIGKGGVEKNEVEALKWYRKAAEQGYAEAQYDLGFMYANGLGFEKIEVEAMKSYRKEYEH